MKKLLFLLILFLGGIINAQLNEVKQLKLLEKKYDSILISYQKKAKDSLSHMTKKERNEIMAREEAKIIERRKIEEYAQLEKIKGEELGSDIFKLPRKYLKCEMEGNFKMPDLLVKTKYKPTVSKVSDENLEGGGGSLESVATFYTTADGYIRNVNTTGENNDFNKQIELTLYRIEKILPRCINGFSKLDKYSMPVKMNFKN
ncbi:hypothetical protein [Chryseobacterium sp. c4a]|uniref:hypothetical protein n=1 Tax=Chryseobacterium sp. c4a TaxID=1573582 RepID=UPI00135BF652|nr:hypothetical protein [Chryseobacterium sp. c4a]